jgi:formiminotetrahydrofolate cyclodeaminase
MNKPQVLMDRPDFPRWTIINFVEQLAEGTPMPGGGCAVAVAGALAAALGALSGQISAKKETDPAQKETLQELQPQMDQARQQFLDLIDADALAYHEVVLARRLPHKTEDEKAIRTEAITRAFARACESPRQMARLGLRVLEWAIKLGERGSPVILADVGVMGFLATAVVHGGLINIFSNLTMMVEAPQTSALRSEAEEIRGELEKRSREFTALIYRQIG